MLKWSKFGLQVGLLYALYRLSFSHSHTSGLPTTANAAHTKRPAYDNAAATVLSLRHHLEQVVLVKLVRTEPLTELFLELGNHVRRVLFGVKHRRGSLIRDD